MRCLIGLSKLVTVMNQVKVRERRSNYNAVSNAEHVFVEVSSEGTNQTDQKRHPPG